DNSRVFVVLGTDVFRTFIDAGWTFALFRSDGRRRRMGRRCQPRGGGFPGASPSAGIRHFSRNQRVGNMDGHTRKHSRRKPLEKCLPDWNPPCPARRVGDGECQRTGKLEKGGRKSQERRRENGQSERTADASSLDAPGNIGNV